MTLIKAKRRPLPVTAVHGEEGSLRVVARVVEVPKTKFPKVVIDLGEAKGIPLSEFQKLEEFVMRVYDWRREHFIEEITK